MSTLLIILIVWVLLPLTVTMIGIRSTIKYYHQKDQSNVGLKIPFVSLFILILGLFWCYLGLAKLGF